MLKTKVTTCLLDMIKVTLLITQVLGLVLALPRLWPLFLVEEVSVLPHYPLFPQLQPLQAVLQPLCASWAQPSFCSSVLEPHFEALRREEKPS